jgi:hypothetical protein
MRVASVPRTLVLSGAALLVFALLVPLVHADAGAAPPQCEGKRATIVGTSGDDVLRGTEGDDVMVGLGGDDRLVGGGGNDVMCGSAGDDTLAGGPGDDVLRGGDGVDWAAYGLAPRGVLIDLAEGTATGWGSDRVVSIENVLGSPFEDEINGDQGPNTLLGGDRRDFLHGLGGDDHLEGGNGDDRLSGGGGADVIDGGKGQDRIRGGYGDDVLRGRSGNDDIWPGGGNDEVDGGSGADLASYDDGPRRVKVDLRSGSARGFGVDRLAGIEEIDGTPHDDMLLGDAAGNRLRGGEGDDLARGREGRDFLQGGDGEESPTTDKPTSHNARPPHDSGGTNPAHLRAGSSNQHQRCGVEDRGNDGRRQAQPEPLGSPIRHPGHVGGDAEQRPRWREPHRQGSSAQLDDLWDQLPRSQNGRGPGGQFGCAHVSLLLVLSLQRESKPV